MTDRYFGAYCAQCNVWLRKDDSTLLFYPSMELVRAELSTDTGIPGIHFARTHLFEPTEFGTEQPIAPDSLPPGVTLCPTIADDLRQRQWRRTLFPKAL